MAVTTTSEETAAEEKKAHPIFAAAKGGDLAAITAALAEDPKSATALTEAHRSALSLAAAKGHVEVVKTLLEAGAVDSAVAGWTSVHHAAFGGHSEVLAAIAAKFGAGALTPAGNMSPLLLAASRATSPA